MASLYVSLKESLTGIKSLIILGAGSELKSDDAAGVAITNNLIDIYGEDRQENLKVYSGNTAPENYTGLIKRFKPEHVIIIDAADINEEPGSAMIIDPCVVSGVSFSTHMLPLKVMIEYIKKDVGCNITIIGIQPQDLSFAGEMTPKVREAVMDVTEVLIKLISVLKLV